MEFVKISVLAVVLLVGFYISKLTYNCNKVTKNDSFAQNGTERYEKLIIEEVFVKTKNEIQQPTPNTTTEEPKKKSTQTKKPQQKAKVKPNQSLLLPFEKTENYQNVIDGDAVLAKVEKEFPCTDPKYYYNPETAKDRSKILIITAFNEHNTNFYSAASRSKHCYSSLQGYHVINEAVSKDIYGLGAWWVKPFIIQKYLPYYNWVVWMDGDVIIMNYSVPLEDFLDEKYDLIVADDLSGINNGVFMVRSTCWSTRFMRVWWQQRYLYNGGWPVEDNSAFMYVLLKAMSQYLPNEKKYKNNCLDGIRSTIRNDMRWLYCWNDWMNNVVGQSPGKRTHPNIKYVFGHPHGGFNSGPGWAVPNDYHPGDFVLHTKQISENGPKLPYFCSKYN